MKHLTKGYYISPTSAKIVTYEPKQVTRKIKDKEYPASQLVPNEKIHEAIVNRAPTSVIKKEARKNGMKTLREDGIYKVIEGLTTIEEVIRVTQVDDYSN